MDLESDSLNEAYYLVKELTIQSKQDRVLQLFRIMLQMNLWILGPCYMYDETVEHTEIAKRVETLTKMNTMLIEQLAHLTSTAPSLKPVTLPMKDRKLSIIMLLLMMRFPSF